MTHGGNVWQGSGPEAWLDFSANLRPEGPPDWVTRTVTQSISRMRYYPDLSMREARRGLAAGKSERNHFASSFRFTGTITVFIIKKEPLTLHRLQSYPEPGGGDGHGLVGGGWGKGIDAAG